MWDPPYRFICTSRGLSIPVLKRSQGNWRCWQCCSDQTADSKQLHTATAQKVFYFTPGFRILGLISKVEALLDCLHSLRFRWQSTGNFPPRAVDVSPPWKERHPHPFSLVPSSTRRPHNGRQWLSLIRNRMAPMCPEDPSSSGISFNFPRAEYVLYT